MQNLWQNGMKSPVCWIKYSAGFQNTVSRRYK